jgi:hypothetical protein
MNDTPARPDTRHAPDTYESRLKGTPRGAMARMVRRAEPPRVRATAQPSFTARWCPGHPERANANANIRRPIESAAIGGLFQLFDWGGVFIATITSRQDDR